MHLYQQQNIWFDQKNAQRCLKPPENLDQLWLRQPEHWVSLHWNIMAATDVDEGHTDHISHATLDFWLFQDCFWYWMITLFSTMFSDSVNIFQPLDDGSGTLSHSARISSCYTDSCAVCHSIHHSSFVYRKLRCLQNVHKFAWFHTEPWMLLL